MWILIVITCVHLDCNYVEIKNTNFRSLAACEAAIKANWDKVKPGTGMMCYKNKDIST